MNTLDAAKILKVLKVSYPNAYKDITKEDANETIELWATMFEEYSVELVFKAVKSVVKTNVYHPTIAHVQEKLNLLTDSKEDKRGESEAWSQVYKAIQNSTYNSIETFERFDEVLKKIVGSPNQLREWGKMDVEKLLTIEKSHFLRSYRQLSKQKEDMKSLGSIDQKKELKPKTDQLK